jgi:hypothetical protein
MDFFNFTKLLSSYFDKELSVKICSKIEEQISCDSNCQVFFNTLKKTIYLCGKISNKEVPEEARFELLRALYSDVELK